METYHLEKRMVFPDGFNFHNLCCFLGLGVQFIPLHWWNIGIVWNSFDTVPEEKYLMPKQWDHLVSDLLKLASGCVVDVVRNLFLVSRWFNLTTGQTGHISEGLHAMLEVADKCFWNPSSFPCLKYIGVYSTTAFSNSLILGDPTFMVILFSKIRMSMKQREGRWPVPVCSCCNI